MGEILDFLWKAVVFVTLPLYLIAQFVRRLKSDKPAGQWLFELAVILTILGIIAAVAIPDFLKFQAKAKCSEVKTNLGAIQNAQVRYISQHNTYAGGPDAFMYLDWKPYNGSIYSYYCGDDYLPNFNPNSPERPRIGREHRPASVGVSATGFTCAAVGNIDNDPGLDVWIVNDMKQFLNEPSDL